MSPVLIYPQKIGVFTNVPIQEWLATLQGDGGIIPADSSHPCAACVLVNYNLPNKCILSLQGARLFLARLRVSLFLSLQPNRTKLNSGELTSAYLLGHPSFPMGEQTIAFLHLIDTDIS